MTGINFNVQNSYAALYNTNLTQPDNTTRATTESAVSEIKSTAISRGEQLTLSAEAIALSQQTAEPTPPADVTPTGGGEGIRPPAATPLGGGEGIRPPAATPLGGGEGIRPPEVTPLGGGEGIRPPEVTPLGGGEGIRPPLTT
jgi:hypothetical protein